MTRDAYPRSMREAFPQTEGYFDAVERPRPSRFDHADRIVMIGSAIAAVACAVIMVIYRSAP
jgi:hypothetical protein